MPQSPRATSLYPSQRGVARLAGLWRSARAMRTLQFMTSPHGVGPGHGEPENTHGSLGMRYSRKIWRGFKFGGLVVRVETAKLKSANIIFACNA